MDAATAERPATALQPQKPVKKRNLGFDLFRFWGVFCIFIGHNYNIMKGVYSDITNSNPEVLNAPTWWQEFAYPSLWINLVLTGVPLFIMIAGFHSLGKPVRATDWVDTKRTFVKYVVFFFKWAILGAFLLLVFPRVFDYTYPNNGILNVSGFAETFELILENIIITSTSKGFLFLNAINWTTLALGWAAVLCFIMRPVFQSKNIKAIRAITLIAVVMCLVAPTIRDMGTYYLSLYPDSLVFKFMSNFAFFSTTGFRGHNWDNFWFPMLMMGGLYAVDEKMRNRVRSWSWAKIGIISAVLVVLFVIIGHYYGLISDYAAVTGTAATIYWRCGWMPASIAWFIIADKINVTCTEESKLGKFILKYGEDNIGAMAFSWAFGSVLQGTVLSFIYTWMNATITSGPVMAFAFITYNIAFYAILVIIVHWLRKVPYVGSLFYWDKIKIFDKERELVLLKAKEKADAKPTQNA